MHYQLLLFQSEGGEHQRTLAAESFGMTDSVTALLGQGHQRTLTAEPFGITDSVSFVQGFGHQRTVGPDQFGVTDAVAAQVVYQPPAVPAVGPRPVRWRAAAPLPPVYFTVGGKPVLMGQGWSGTAKVPGGFDQFRGRILEKDRRRLRVGQFTVLRGDLPDGFVVWEGRLPRDPVTTARVAELEAQGHKVRAEKASSPLLYLTRELSLLQLGDYRSGNINTQNVENGLLVEVPAGTTLNGGDELWWDLIARESPGVATLTGGGNPGPGSGLVALRRMAFDWKVIEVSSSKVIVSHIFKSGDPTYSPNAFDDDPDERSEALNQLLNAISGSVDWDLTTQAFPSGTNPREVSSKTWDVVRFRFRISASHTQAIGYRFLLTNFRVGGIATGDTMVASAIVADHFSRLGVRTDRVRTSTLDLLPYFVRQSWDKSLTYVAAVADWFWGIWESVGGQPDGEFAPFEETVVASQAGDCVPALAPLEKYSHAVAAYEDAGGVRQVVRVAASPNPLAGTGQTNDYPPDGPLEITDRQADSAFATGAATRLIAHRAQGLWTGSVELRRVRDAAGWVDPRKVRPGRQLRVHDFTAPAATHRLAEMEYGAGGARAGVESSQSIESVLGHLAPGMGPAPRLEDLEPMPPPEPPPSSEEPGAEEPEEPGVPPVPGEEAPPPGPPPGSPPGPHDHWHDGFHHGKQHHWKKGHGPGAHPHRPD